MKNTDEWVVTWPALILVVTGLALSVGFVYAIYHTGYSEGEEAATVKYEQQLREVMRLCK